ncbi:DUF3576 domain-containing protein [Henriciella aquimarina]|uniref:DUF3576 domain-containing protein n=1 Tax=Henriciella aquimarina TaxID=545261 RepID=UPI00117AEA48|nr:DUF3576 domain-containing protein [Henriciella aquimarina]
MKRTLQWSAAIFAALALTGCIFGGGSKDREISVVEDFEGGVNPYLWRASLDTLQTLPLKSADPVGGIINYDWKTYENAAGERIKATVYILDSRLRADGVKVSVFRQVQQDGDWVDADIDPETGIQLENAILTRARVLKSAEIS